MKTLRIGTVLSVLTLAIGCSRGGSGGGVVVTASPSFVAPQTSDTFYIADGELIQSRMGVMIGNGFLPGASGVQLTPENDCLYVFLDEEDEPTYKILPDGEFLDVEEGDYSRSPNAKLTQVIWRDVVSVCRLKQVDDSAILAIGEFYGAGQEYFDAVGDIHVAFLEGDHFNVYGVVKTQADSAIDATYHFCIRLEPYEGKYHILEEDLVHMINVDDPSDTATLNSHGLDVSNDYLLGWFNYRHDFQGDIIGRAEEHVATTGFYAQIRCD